MQLVKDDIVKDDILLEAQKLFMAYGLKKTTMEDIAKALGKGKSTLYYYYNSKEEIFQEVLLKEMDQVFEQTKNAVDNAETATEKLNAFAVTKIATLKKTMNLYRIVCGEMTEKIGCTKGLHNQYGQQEESLLESILRFGIANTEFNKLIEQEMDILPSIIVSCFSGLEREYFNNEKLVGLENRIGAITTLLVKGLEN